MWNFLGSDEIGIEKTDEKPIRNSTQLLAKIALIRPQLLASASRMWDHPALADFFGEYLIALHTVIRATVHSMTIAGECARKRALDDRVAAPLAEYYFKHASEEQNHDEWLLDDIAALGISRSEVRRRIPMPAAAALVGAQYYWAYHVNPVAYLGHIAVLEIPTDSATEFYESVIQRTGLPRKAFQTQLFHAALDKRHEEDFYDLVDRLPLTSDHRALIGVSAFVSAGSMAHLYDEIVKGFEYRRKLGN